MSPHPFFSQRSTVFMLAPLCCLLWGSAYPAIKAGYELFAIAAGDIPSKMVFAGYRFVFAGLVLLVLAQSTRKNIFAIDWRKFHEVVALGLTQTTIQYVFFYVGLANTTGVKGSIINSVGTFFSVFLAHFIYANDRLSANKIAGCLAGFAGVLVVNFNPELLDFRFTLLGEGFVVIAAFILAAATIYGKKISQRMDSVVLTGYQLAIGGIVLLLVGYVSGGSIGGFTTKSTALLAYLILLLSVAFGLWTILLKYNRVGMVTIFNFLIPVSGVSL
ncbi:MAG: DMT family transporter [Propionivibrio sp.]